MIKESLWACRLGLISWSILLTMPVFAALTTSDSRSVIRSSGGPAKILLVDGGYIGRPPSDAKVQVFTTRKKCPANFTPFVTMDVGKVMYTTIGRDYLSAFTGCANNIVINPNFYTVNYYIFHNWAQVAAADNASPQTWVSNTNLSLTLGSAVKMFYTQNYGGYYGNYNSVAALSWRLYCYPPGMDTPLHQIETGLLYLDPKSPWNNGCY